MDLLHIEQMYCLAIFTCSAKTSSQALITIILSDSRQLGPDTLIQDCCMVPGTFGYEVTESSAEPQGVRLAFQLFSSISTLDTSQLELSAGAQGQSLDGFRFYVSFTVSLNKD
ncbi:hypothetical protein RRG08_005091 [Elysia crispata]|uniref:Uncharacterized protein n=1 Tax=Elysia crispata TaxID=231223 RepID=A0AAE1CPQ9_9GAST|nr:hypothetical protein RRG08_005091 [Elysia crispata]